MVKIYRLLGIVLLILLTLILGIYLRFYIVTQPYIFAEMRAAPSTRVALVPGAAITPEGTMSSVFQARVDGAVSLYQTNKVTKILVSGDNGTLSHNEVDPARVYLIAHGVADADIFLDHAGFDTYSSMYRARDIFGVTSLTIVTQSFHLPRAVFIARELGMEAYGVRTDITNLRPSNYLRELLANVKAVIDLILNRTPKFLGEQVPIEGDGRNYP